MTTSAKTIPERLYGRWADQLHLTSEGSPKTFLAHRYIIPICPRSPVRVGVRVQIIALSPSVYRTTNPIASRGVYDVYDPHIEGEVVGVKLDGCNLVSFAIRNERHVSKVAVAVVVLPYIAGVSAIVAEVDTTCSLLFGLPELRRRPAWFDEEARVMDNLGELPTPSLTLVYPNPETYTHDVLITDLGLAGQIGRGHARRLAYTG